MSAPIDLKYEGAYVFFTARQLRLLDVLMHDLLSVSSDSFLRIDARRIQRKVRAAGVQPAAQDALNAGVEAGSHVTRNKPSTRERADPIPRK